ncbi:hypothetical protein FF38_04148 [Lucilia cuprina]|uniref:Uncharacterized protein n=1 Tax=Lucilia cuprina TaxID=7375 RepID=A0A0L0C152_LUCCU|nr:hypothetical protein FF38_04148 [Lucilia cuprina]
MDHILATRSLTLLSISCNHTIEMALLFRQQHLETYTQPINQEPSLCRDNVTKDVGISKVNSNPIAPENFPEVHLKSLPVCRRLCFFRKYLVVKAFEQTSHSQILGFSVTLIIAEVIFAEISLSVDVVKGIKVVVVTLLLLLLLTLEDIEFKFCDISAEVDELKTNKTFGACTIELSKLLEGKSND